MIIKSKSNRYQMWMAFDGGKQKLQFPLLPESVSVSMGNATKSVDILGLGEFLMNEDRPAQVISFDVVFPANKFVNQKTSVLQKPETQKNFLMRWKESGLPIKFMITETGINLFVLITDLKYEERGGDKGSIYMSLTLKEYRSVTTRQAEIDANGNVIIIPLEVNAEPVNDVVPSVYTIKKGDTLKLLAKKYYKDSSRYKDIVKINPQIKNPALLKTGMVLKMPKR